MHCLVTVGSTQFDALIESVLNEKVLKLLNGKGFGQLYVQCGSGKIDENFIKLHNENDETWIDKRFDIDIRLFRYKNNINEEMRRADLIIGHAGAGTCLEALELEKPLIVVINNRLADNHQTELAERLAQDGHLLFTTPEDLTKTLEEENLFSLIPFPKRNPKIFAEFLNDYLGIDSSSLQLSNK